MTWLWTPLLFVGIILTIWCVFFFRDPKRVTPLGAGLVIAPADGVVQAIVDVEPPPELAMGVGPWTRISIFMNVFDVHVNRAPVAGTIKCSTYRPGKFFDASLDKASEHNERHGLLFQTPDGTEIGCVQIAGLIARRILCEVAEGQEVNPGERIGMIRFGSRVDIFVPAKSRILVIEGQRAVAGETVTADLQDSGVAREGKIH
tara:strand:+ start:213 stop:821 length:609 start_codon:yes stop_codon:yes gene_type:complete